MKKNLRNIRGACDVLDSADGSDLSVFEEETGANLVEYALLASLIAIVCISAMSFLGGQTSQTLQSVGDHLGKAVGSS